MTIHEKAKELMSKDDISTCDWHSDLYLRKNQISEQLVADYEFKSNVKTFIDQIDHVRWYDIPLANDDYWKKEKEAREIYGAKN